MVHRDVWIDSVVQPQEGSGLNAAAVHFTPGARAAWHVHESGQTLYVPEGEGPGDVVHTPSGEWHWHGASLDPPLPHRGSCTWGEHVADVEYQGGE